MLYRIVVWYVCVHADAARCVRALIALIALLTTNEIMQARRAHHGIAYMRICVYLHSCYSCYNRVLMY